MIGFIRRNVIEPLIEFLGQIGCDQSGDDIIECITGNSSDEPMADFSDAVPNHEGLRVDAESIRNGTEEDNAMLRNILGDGVFQLIREGDAPIGQYEITAHTESEDVGLSVNNDKSI